MPGGHTNAIRGREERTGLVVACICGALKLLQPEMQAASQESSPPMANRPCPRRLIIGPPKPGQACNEEEE
eukprot:15453103-Alexandrium_andersonii.AAC.1